MENEIDLDQLADEILNSGRVVVDAIKGIRGVEGAIKIIPGVIQEVEAVGRKFSLAGKDKRALAVKVLNKAIDIPVAPEALEAVIFGFVIDACLALANKWLGHNWLEKLHSNDE